MNRSRTSGRCKSLILMNVYQRYNGSPSITSDGIKPMVTLIWTQIPYSSMGIFFVSIGSRMIPLKLRRRFVMPISPIRCVKSLCSFMVVYFNAWVLLKLCFDDCFLWRYNFIYPTILQSFIIKPFPFCFFNTFFLKKLSWPEGTPMTMKIIRYFHTKEPVLRKGE